MTIKYVCLSDMHLGQDNSLLTNLIEANAVLDHSSASPVMKALCDALQELIEHANAGSGVKPVLILNGDILELALADVNDASMVFSRFIECTMPKDNEIFSEMIYIPGNHDHHIWELVVRFII
ncbi:MAG: metallophosphoesterase [Desulfomonilia bacterium]